MKSLQERFVETALKSFNKLAIIDTATKKNYTYKQILVGSVLLSKQIRELCDASIIGIMIPVSAGAVIAKMATLMAGKTPAMINYSTGALQNCEYARMRCGIKLILTSRALLQRLNIEATDDMIMMEDIIESIRLYEKVYELVRIKSAIKRIHLSEEDENAVILFTSGSEKEPKVVPLTHKNIGSNYDAIIKAIPVSPEDIYLAVLPFFHVFGMTTSLWTPLLIGGTLITHANPLDFKGVVESIKNYKANCLFATPAFFHGYYAKAHEGDFNSLRILVAGGDKLPKEIYDSYLKTHHLEILEGYGTTELSPVVAVNRVGQVRLGSIGLPLDNLEVKICAIESDEILPSGMEGRLLVKGPNVMLGYMGDQEATEKVLKDGWYDTGDMAMIDEDGFIFHKGRLKRFIKIAGEMVSMVKIEEEVQAVIPAQTQICAVAKHHEIKGSEIAIAFKGEFDSQKVREELSHKLPPLFIPKVFVPMDTIPLLGTGKVNFREVERIVNA